MKSQFPWPKKAANTVLATIFVVFIWCVSTAAVFAQPDWAQKGNYLVYEYSGAGITATLKFVAENNEPPASETAQGRTLFRVDILSAEGDSENVSRLENHWRSGAQALWLTNNLLYIGGNPLSWLKLHENELPVSDPFIGTINYRDVTFYPLEDVTVPAGTSTAYKVKDPDSTIWYDTSTGLLIKAVNTWNGHEETLSLKETNISSIRLRPLPMDLLIYVVLATAAGGAVIIFSIFRKTRGGS